MNYAYPEFKHSEDKIRTAKHELFKCALVCTLGVIAGLVAAQASVLMIASVSLCVLIELIALYGLSRRPRSEIRLDAGGIWQSSKYLRQNIAWNELKSVKVTKDGLGTIDLIQLTHNSGDSITIGRLEDMEAFILAIVENAPNAHINERVSSLHAIKPTVSVLIVVFSLAFALGYAGPLCFEYLLSKELDIFFGPELIVLFSFLVIGWGIQGVRNKGHVTLFFGKFHRHYPVKIWKICIILGILEILLVAWLHWSA